MKLKQINGKELELDLSSEAVQRHAQDPNNYFEVVVNEFNSEPFKGYITAGDKVILDIGANVGLFALVALPYAQKIILVEPTPEHQAVSKELLKGIKFKTFIYESSALHNYTGKCGFHKEGGNTTMNRVSDTPGQTDCITLADLCKKYGLDKVNLCKIDIEGGEFAALTEETIKPVFDIIDRFMIEVHPLTREGQEHFCRIFNEAGYKTELMPYNAGVFAHK